MISIIIATFNAEKTINTLFNSIRRQTCEDYEVIVIDGGSEDRTVEIIKRNSDLVSTFVSESDKGIYDAWNKGLKFASFDWICFIGADDILKTNFIEIYRHAIVNLPNLNIQYICSKANYIDSKGKLIKTIGTKFRWEEFKNNMTIPHVGSMHNKFLFDEIGLFNPEYKVVGDYELLLRKKGKLSTFFIDKVLLDIKAGGVSLSSAALFERFRAQRKVAKLNFLRAYFNLIVGQLLLLKFKLDPRFRC